MPNNLLATSEWNKVLYEWNKTAAAFPENITISQLFENQVNQTPNNIALYYHSQTMTFNDLNSIANKMANFLIQQGADQHTFVALSMQPSFFMIISILAVFKVGSVLVPIEPSYPSGRKKYILEDAQVKILLTDNTTKPSFPFFTGKKIETDKINIHHLKGENLSHKVRPNQTAYIIYTSGTTGKPKGVMGYHRGFINTITDNIERFSLVEGSRVLQYASISFDSSLWEMGVSLFSGNTLVLLDKAEIEHCDALHKALTTNKITHALLPPCILTKMSQNNLPYLKILISAGELCPPSLLKWSQNFSFYNAYGMTEVSILSTFYQIKPNQRFESSILIGRPINNTKIYVLNSDLQPVTYNQPGDLFVSGVGVTKGYLNMPEMTANKYMTDPFYNGEIMYKTGDIVKYNHEGDLEYIGRADRQIKINDFRIGLYEVETALLECEEISNAAVVVDEVQEPILNAYVTLNKNVSVDYIKKFIRNILPAPALPNAIHVLDQMPLTSNGKIDYAAFSSDERKKYGTCD